MLCILFLSLSPLLFRYGFSRSQPLYFRRAHRNGLFFYLLTLPLLFFYSFPSADCWMLAKPSTHFQLNGNSNSVNTQKTIDTHTDTQINNHIHERSRFSLSADFSFSRFQKVRCVNLSKQCWGCVSQSPFQMAGIWHFVWNAGNWSAMTLWLWPTST